MNKPSSLVWMVFIFLVILPTPAGKLIIDLAGGFFLLISTIPLVLGGVAWITWKRIKSKVKTCKGCGASFINNEISCPICGTDLSNSKDSYENIPASAATIDIKSENIDL
tara:strand:+ start:475 stop:804 length:330 start_codon:yes stop_codon:yes gene_type:complete